jgi:uncharacterized protein involved in outer membrane biogenesis
MAKAKRVLVRVAIAIIVLVAVLFVVVNVALGPIVKEAVEMAGPAVAGVAIKVDQVRIFPLLGSARIDGLVVGAPEGYNANLVAMKHFRAKVRLASLLTDTIVVREIVISGPEVTYELSGMRSNVGALLEAFGGEGEDAAPVAPKSGTPGKKLVLEHFLFEGGKVRLATTLTGGKGIVLPMPTVELRDVGKETEGVSMVAVIQRTTVAVSVAVLTTVRDGVAGVAGLGADAAAAIAGAAGAGLQTAGKLTGQALVAVGKGASAVVGATVEGVQAVGGLAVEGAKAVGGAASQGAKAVGGLASDGVKAVGGAATKGAKAVGGAASEGAKAVGGALRSVGGLFGAKPEEKAEAAAKPTE